MALLTPPFTAVAASRTGTRSSMRPPPLTDDTGLGIGLGCFNEKLQQEPLGNEAAIRLRRPHVRNGHVVTAQRKLPFGDGRARPWLALERGFAGQGALRRRRHAAERDTDIFDDATC